MNTNLTFPKLRNLLGGYFHQDWKYDYNWEGHQPNFEEVVRFYKVVNPVTTVSQAINELHNFLNLQMSETDLSELFKSAGICYNPKARKMTYRYWLERILEILEDPLATTSYLQETQPSEWTGWKSYSDSNQASG
jgi:hypothetical protein